MQLKYHYSMFANVISFLFGLFFLYVASDFLFLHTAIFKDYNPPRFVLWIVFFLGSLLVSGALKNLISGKKYLIEADKQGILIHTGSIKKDSADFLIKWGDFCGVESRWIRSVMEKNHAGTFTKALVIKMKAGSLEWPAVMIMKNLIYFEKGDKCDEMILTAWLNKSNKSIIREINQLASDCNVKIK